MYDFLTKNVLKLQNVPIPTNCILLLSAAHLFAIRGQKNCFLKIALGTSLLFEKLKELLQLFLQKFLEVLVDFFLKILGVVAYGSTQQNKDMFNKSATIKQ